jgi:hypothetical protein
MSAIRVATLDDVPIVAGLVALHVGGEPRTWVPRIAGRAPEAWYVTNARNHRSLRLHERLGFREVTRDFVFPGVTFEGGVGVLSRAELALGRDR